MLISGRSKVRSYDWLVNFPSHYFFGHDKRHGMYKNAGALRHSNFYMCHIHEHNTHSIGPTVGCVSLHGCVGPMPTLGGYRPSCSVGMLRRRTRHVCKSEPRGRGSASPLSGNSTELRVKLDRVALDKTPRRMLFCAGPNRLNPCGANGASTAGMHTGVSSGLQRRPCRASHYLSEKANPPPVRPLCHYYR